MLDQAIRDQIATDLDRNLLVEAAAGTGKTTCLIARMIALLRAGKCRVETLAAVTFTRKAAAELRTRFQLALEQCARNTTGPEQKRVQDALREVERCFIGTIHSFCGHDCCASDRSRPATTPHSRTWMRMWTSS
ncbi:MAG: UvrD-helicase domain-containing protein [Gemmataceae bacterium]